MSDKEIIEAYRVALKELTSVIESLNVVIAAQNKTIIDFVTNDTKGKP